MDSTRRIPFEELPAELTTRLQARVERLGYLGEFFQVGAQQPAALAGFIDFTEALKAELPYRLVEVIALTAASTTQNDYERVQHERLALKLGFTGAEVEALVSGASLEDFSADEQAAAALAREVCAAAGGRCESYQELRALVGDAIAVGCLMTAVRYLAHATMANTWGLEAPVSSPLKESTKT